MEFLVQFLLKTGSFSHLYYLNISVQISSILSNPIELFFGVSQDLVLGLLLFIIYTNPLRSVLSKAKDIKHNLYTDDTQFLQHIQFL